jgi:aspartokinase
VSKIKIGGILIQDHLAIIRISGVDGQDDAAATYLSLLGESGININFITHLLDQKRHDHLVIAVNHDDLQKAFDLACSNQVELKASAVSFSRNVASGGIYGPDFRLRPGIAGALLQVLANQKISVQAISTSVSTCSALIPSDRLGDAVKAIEQAFEMPFNE